MVIDPAPAMDGETAGPQLVLSEWEAESAREKDDRPHDGQRSGRSRRPRAERRHAAVVALRDEIRGLLLGYDIDAERAEALVALFDSRTVRGSLRSCGSERSALHA